jgi:hypothetical protein
MSFITAVDLHTDDIVARWKYRMSTFFKYGIGILMTLMFEDDHVIIVNKEDILQRPAYELNTLLIDYNFNIASLPPPLWCSDQSSWLQVPSSFPGATRF